VTAWAWIALGARKPSLSLIVVTEGKVRQMRHKGHDSARVNARLERRIGPELAEEEVRLAQHEAPIWPEQAHAWSVASVLI
jgi:hypothetical protein